MQWIVEEVDGLVASGVLTAESGEALRRHYRARLAREESGNRAAVLAVLGAALIGGGIILIIAHNWDELGRPARVVLSFLPLLISLALSCFALLRRAGSTPWREGAGVAQCAGVAASIALVSQTYHIAGELSDFLFTWLILILPLPYLLRAVMPALIYLAGIALWAGSSSFSTPDASPGYWLFLAAILPFYAMELRRDRLGKPAAWLSAFIGLSAPFGLGFSLERLAPAGIWIPAFVGLFGFFYLAGALGFPERRYHPLRVIGGLGIAGLTLILSYPSNWPDMTAWMTFPATGWLSGGASFGAALLLPAAALALAARAWLRKAGVNAAAAFFIVAGTIAYGLNRIAGYEHGAVAAAVAMNLYGLALALGTAFRGIRQRAAITFNSGLLILAALILARFADSGFGILERGVAFIVLGALVLAANLWLLKTKKEGAA